MAPRVRSRTLEGEATLTRGVGTDARTAGTDRTPGRDEAKDGCPRSSEGTTPAASDSPGSVARPLSIQAALLACAADRVVVGVLRRELVSVDAVRLGTVPCRQRLPGEDVHLPGDSAQVIRTYAATVEALHATRAGGVIVVALMVNLKVSGLTGRDSQRGHGYAVDPAVRADRSPLDLAQRVSGGCHVPGPVPAPVLLRLDFGPEPGRQAGVSEPNNDLGSIHHVDPFTVCHAPGLLTQAPGSRL